jgi:hypothetical protein
MSQLMCNPEAAKTIRGSGNMHIDTRRDRLASAHLLQAFQSIQDAMDLIADTVAITEA